MKIDTIARLGKPECLRDVQKLAGRVAALSRFIPRLGEKAMPLYRLMRKNPTFQWEKDEDDALRDLKNGPPAEPLLPPPRRQRTHAGLRRGFRARRQRRHGRRTARGRKG